MGIFMLFWKVIWQTPFQILNFESLTKYKAQFFGFWKQNIFTHFHKLMIEHKLTNNKQPQRGDGLDGTLQLHKLYS